MDMLKYPKKLFLKMNLKSKRQWNGFDVSGNGFGACIAIHIDTWPTPYTRFPEATVCFDKKCILAVQKKLCGCTITRIIVMRIHWKQGLCTWLAAIFFCSPIEPINIKRVARRLPCFRSASKFSLTKKNIKIPFAIIIISNGWEEKNVFNTTRNQIILK